jgi:hypothetical protein
MDNHTRIGDTPDPLAAADMPCGYCCRCSGCECGECTCCLCFGCRCPT